MTLSLNNALLLRLALHAVKGVNATSVKTLAFTRFKNPSGRFWMDLAENLAWLDKLPAKLEQARTGIVQSMVDDSQGIAEGTPQMAEFQAKFRELLASDENVSYLTPMAFNFEDNGDAMAALPNEFILALKYFSESK